MKRLLVLALVVGLAATACGSNKKSSSKARQHLRHHLERAGDDLDLRVQPVQRERELPLVRHRSTRSSPTSTA